MKVLKGKDREIYINYLLKAQVGRIKKFRPRSISTNNMDYELRGRLIEILPLYAILPEFDGRRIRLSYLEEE